MESPATLDRAFASAFPKWTPKKLATKQHHAVAPAASHAATPPAPRNCDSDSAQDEQPKAALVGGAEHPGEPSEVTKWLRRHGIDDHAAGAFARHKIDRIEILAQLSKDDLRHVIGVVGDAIRVHEALHPRKSSQHGGREVRAPEALDKVRQWCVAEVCKWLLKVEQEDLIPAFKKAGINGQSLIELMHLQINSPDYLRKALMEHIGISEYGRVLSFSMSDGGHVCVNTLNEVEEKMRRDQAGKEGGHLHLRELRCKPIESAHSCRKNDDSQEASSGYSSDDHESDSQTVSPLVADDVRDVPPTQEESKFFVSDRSSIIAEASIVGGSGRVPGAGGNSDAGGGAPVQRINHVTKLSIANLNIRGDVIPLREYETPRGTFVMET